MAGLRAALQTRGVSPTVVDVCRIQAILPSVPIGCYNQTAAGQLVPAHYMDYLEVRRLPHATGGLLALPCLELCRPGARCLSSKQVMVFPAKPVVHG